MNLTSFARPHHAVTASCLATLKFEHANTVLSARPSQPRLLTGFTLWASGDLQLGWDWAEMDRQVYALFAPMSIFANAVLVDGVGMPLSEGNTALELNKLVRKLPWQDAVAHQVATTAKRSRPRAPSALMAA